MPQSDDPKNNTRTRTAKGGWGLEVKVSNGVMIAFITCLGTFLTGLLALATSLLR